MYFLLSTFYVKKRESFYIKQNPDKTKYTHRHKMVLFELFQKQDNILVQRRQQRCLSLCGCAKKRIFGTLKVQLHQRFYRRRWGLPVAAELEPPTPPLFIHNGIKMILKQKIFKKIAWPLHSVKIQIIGGKVYLR